MRYICEEPGFEAAFLELPDSGWSRKDMRELRTLDESDAWFALLRRKLTAVHLPTLDGEAITSAAELTPEGLDRVDLVLFNWFVASLVRGLGDVGQLGNAVWRRLFATPETGDATEPQTQP